MPNQQISYLPYDEALKIIGAIQEEEHPHELNRRIFTNSCPGKNQSQENRSPAPG
jgi:hypothetical protein